jgi:hypothetical protein
MGKREIELRDAMASSWAAARLSGGQFRALVPVYGGRLGVALQVMRGQQIRQRRRTVAMAAIVATISGAAAAFAIERMIAHREPAGTGTEPATEVVDTTSEAAFTNQ